MELTFSNTLTLSKKFQNPNFRLLFSKNVKYICQIEQFVLHKNIEP